LVLGLYLAPAWPGMDAHHRVYWLLALVAAGGASYLATLFAMGFRLRELREH
jgi:putative peptidoglycan lipid II flippase